MPNTYLRVEYSNLPSFDPGRLCLVLCHATDGSACHYISSQQLRLEPKHTKESSMGLESTEQSRYLPTTALLCQVYENGGRDTTWRRDTAGPVDLHEKL